VITKHHKEEVASIWSAGSMNEDLEKEKKKAIALLKQERS